MSEELLQLSPSRLGRFQFYRDASKDESKPKKSWQDKDIHDRAKALAKRLMATAPKPRKAGA